MVKKVESQKFMDLPKKVEPEDDEVVEEIKVEKIKVEPEPKPEKKKRAPSAYNLFVKEQMAKLKDTPPKERFSKISELWKKEKAKKEKKTKKK